MPPILRDGSFLFILQSQPFYQAQLVPMTTISILGSLAAVGKLHICLALFTEKSEMGLVYEEWMDKDG